jgi:hypothetical protein
MSLSQCGYVDKISQKQCMIKTNTKHNKPNHKKEQTNIRNSNLPPSAVGFTRSGDGAQPETKQTANKEKGNNQIESKVNPPDIPAFLLSPRYRDLRGIVPITIHHFSQLLVRS